jgi:hypothetical protein
LLAGRTRITGAERRVRNSDSFGVLVSVGAVAAVTLRGRLRSLFCRYAAVRFAGSQLGVGRNATLRRVLPLLASWPNHGLGLPGGGFDWWGNGEPLIWLSAYGLQEFNDMAKVYPIDRGVIDRTQKCRCHCLYPP